MTWRKDWVRLPECLLMNEKLSKINPEWKRPNDWPYEEDWNSPAWKAIMKEAENRSRAKREKFGFVWCPECKAGHTNKTICCRECNYKVEIET